MQSSPTKKLLVLYITLSVLALQAIIGGVYFIDRTNKKASELAIKLEETTNNNVLIQSLKSIEGGGDELNSLNKLALSENDLVSFIENLEQLGKRMGLSAKIAAVDAENDAGEGGLRKVKIVVETTGSWQSSLQFIHAVENIPLRTIINNSTMTLISEQNDFSNSTTTPPAKKSAWKTSTVLVLYLSK